MRRYLISIVKNNEVIREFNSGTDALEIEADISVVDFGKPINNSTLRIKGITINELRQCEIYEGCKISLSGGFSRGLPLENPLYYGELCKATIQVAYGNWQDTEQYIDFILIPRTDMQVASFQLEAGKTLNEFLKLSLLALFKDPIIVKDTSKTVILPYTVSGVYDNINDLTRFARSLNKNIIISETNGVVSINDAPSEYVQTVTYLDIIGQPTFLAAATVSFTTHLRADIQVNDTVVIDRMLTTTNKAQAIYTQQSKISRDNLSWNGKVLITSVRHLLHSRATDASSWTSNFEGVIL